jgi:hypothetical protein
VSANGIAQVAVQAGDEVEEHRVDPVQPVADLVDHLGGRTRVSSVSHSDAISSAR